MIKTYKSILAAVAVGALALGASSSALAVAQLRLTDQAGNTITIADNGGGDAAPGTGTISYSNFGGLFTGWTITVSTGTSKGGEPNSSATNPIMHLNVVAVSSGAGTMTIDFTDTSFTKPTTAAFGASFGGVVNGAAGSSLVYTTYRDNANNFFGDGTDADGIPGGGTTAGTGSPDAANLLTTQTFGPGAGSGTKGTVGVTQSASYSLTQRFVFTHTAAGSSSGDGTLQAPDGGVTAALLGCAFLGLAIVRRKFQMA